MASLKGGLRIPSLDGLRAFSIGLVIVAHVFDGIQRRATLREPIIAIARNGSLGVSVFFVISGFLITSLLIREAESTGTISLRKFYQRRAFRILPAYLLYVSAIATLSAVGALHVPLTDLARALTFSWDYFPSARSWEFQHTWTLSVEEQFYLTWPALVAFLPRRAARFTALGIILLSPAIRVLQAAVHLHAQDGAGNLAFMLHTRLDTLMFGCLAALLAEDLTLASVRRKMSWLVAVLAIFTVVVSPLLTLRFGGRYLYIIGYTVEGLSITLGMLWAIEHPSGLIGRILNSRAAVTIGVGSYSLYLWQTLFLHDGSPFFVGHTALRLAMIATSAFLSYKFVEKPMLEFRSRRQRRSVQTEAAQPAT